MSIIVYGNWPILTYEEVKYRNPQYWRGEVEKNVDKIVCDRPQIVEKYKEAGVQHVDTKLNPVTGQDRESTTPSEQEALPEEMTWPQLKSAASKKAGRNIMTKAEALEILQE